MRFVNFRSLIWNISRLTRSCPLLKSNKLFKFFIKHPRIFVMTGRVLLLSNNYHLYEEYLREDVADTVLMTCLTHQ